MSVPFTIAPTPWRSNLSNAAYRPMPQLLKPILLMLSFRSIAHDFDYRSDSTAVWGLSDCSFRPTYV